MYWYRYIKKLYWKISMFISVF